VAAIALWVAGRSHPRVLVEWGHYSAVATSGRILRFSHAPQRVFYNPPTPKTRAWGLFGYGVYRMEFSPSQVVWGATLPLWLIAIVGAALAILAIRRARHVREMQRRAGRCVACGYDLTGNISGICPECGTKVSATPS
jgi:hypothetical protein